jgi:hypothetical protein
MYERLAASACWRRSSHSSASSSGAARAASVAGRLAAGAHGGWTSRAGRRRPSGDGRERHGQRSAAGPSSTTHSSQPVYMFSRGDAAQQGVAADKARSLDRMIGPALPNKRGLRCEPVKNHGAEPQRKAGPMIKMRFVGLDVHKDSITIAVADSDGSAPQVIATAPHENRALLKQLKKLGACSELRCCYEAGPTGFGLCRTLQAAGIECLVVAPSLIPKQAAIT